MVDIFVRVDNKEIEVYYFRFLFGGFIFVLFLILKFYDILKISFKL